MGNRNKRHMLVVPRHLHWTWRNFQRDNGRNDSLCLVDSFFLITIFSLSVQYIKWTFLHRQDHSASDLSHVRFHVIGRAKFFFDRLDVCYRRNQPRSPLVSNALFSLAGLFDFFSLAVVRSTSARRHNLLLNTHVSKWFALEVRPDLWPIYLSWFLGRLQ